MGKNLRLKVLSILFVVLLSLFGVQRYYIFKDKAHSMEEVVVNGTSDFMKGKLSHKWYSSDDDYRKAIIKNSNVSSYNLENIKNVVGPYELAKFIKQNDDNSQIYTPSEVNINNKVFGANFHIHTLNSDGSMSVAELLDKAQDYAKNFPNDKYLYVAVTDHNTVLGAQNVVDVLENNPNKYNKVKVVLGIEVYTAYNNSAIANKPVEIHVLTWAINPYDNNLMKEFYKPNLNDKWNRRYPDRDFDSVISVMQDYGIVGVAHPARYISFLDYPERKAYIDEMLSRYSKLNKHTKFTEGYYQSYKYFFSEEEKNNEFFEFLDYINDTAKSLNICRTGSTDAHGKSIFSK